VIDMTGAEPRPDQTLLIKKDRIAAIGASNTVAIASPNPHRPFSAAEKQTGTVADISTLRSLILY